MDNSFQTSFIPKKPVTTSIERRQPTSLFTVISTFILVVMVLSSIGLFVYKNYLTKQREELSAVLGDIRESFEQDTISELELYDKRASAAKEVLNSHIVLSPMFTLLGSLTVPSIQYTKFEHQTTDKGFFVKISGTARDYRSIALQADAFNTTKGRSFKNVVFSNLTKEKTGFVGFDFEFIVDPALLSYEKNSLLEKAQVKTPSNDMPTSEPDPLPPVSRTALPVDNVPKQ